MKEQPLATSKKLEGSARAAGRAEQVASNLHSKLQASEKKSEWLPTALQDAKTDLADDIATVKKKTTFPETANSELQEDLSSLRAEFESYLRESKSKLDDMNNFYNELQTRLAQSEKERVQY